MKIKMKKKLGIDNRRSKIGNGLVIFLLLLLGAFMAFPLYYTVIQSIKPSEELFQFPPRLYVIRPTEEHYTELFQLMSNLWVPFSRYLFNTLFVSIPSLPLTKAKWSLFLAPFSLYICGFPVFMRPVTF